MISNSTLHFAWGSLIGGLLGAAAVLLLTPISGSELRGKILSQNGVRRADLKVHKPSSTRSRKKHQPSHEVKESSHKVTRVNHNRKKRA